MVKTRAKREKTIILSLVAVLFLTSIYSLTPPLPVIKEEAIEISKTSELVREDLAIARSLTIETRYYNTSRLEELKKWHSGPIFKNVPKSTFWEEKAPEGHTVWEVVWWFSGSGARSETYPVIVIVDAEKGTIIHQEKEFTFFKQLLGKS